VLLIYIDALPEEQVVQLLHLVVALGGPSMRPERALLHQPPCPTPTLVSSTKSPGLSFSLVEASSGTKSSSLEASLVFGYNGGEAWFNGSGREVCLDAMHELLMLDEGRWRLETKVGVAPHATLPSVV
jgi:hypothetical protein